MRVKGRKNVAGGWLLGELFGRAAWAMTVVAAVVGFACGLVVGGTSPIGVAVRENPWWSFLGFLCVAGLAIGLGVLVVRRAQSTWGRGLAAERRVGDRIEHALVLPGCAFAHDVKEALGGAGNVDHVVLTPAGVWVVETKAAWLSKPAFRDALRQTAANVERVRRQLDERDVPVRGALVIADNQDPYEAENEWEGEPVTAFRVVSFWRRLQAECVEEGRSVEPGKREDLARKVWSLGSTRYADA